MKRLLSILFFISGFCSLLYQVVWLRLAFASFGVVTPVLSVVVSVFMLGLFLGTWVGGWLSERESKASFAWWYAGAELLIGIGAFTVPALFAWSEGALLPAGNADSGTYLAMSAIAVTLSIFPWCLCMGMTIPLMMAFIKRTFSEASSFSFLYTANVLGALTGVLATAAVIVETFGFRGSLALAGSLNILIAGVALLLPRLTAGKTAGAAAVESSTATTLSSSALRPEIAKLLLFGTGFCSMAMEVVWTRAFTPVLKTQVYSFALLLFVYLVSTWLGSTFFRRSLARGKVLAAGHVIGLLALSAFLPVVLNDARIHASRPLVLFSIVPFCALLGYLTPRLIDESSLGDPKKAASLYAINTLGCILGPLAAGYLLLPALGVRFTLVVLAIPFILFLLAEAGGSRVPRTVLGGYVTAAVVLGLASCTASRSYEERFTSFENPPVVHRDYTATTVAFGEGMNRRILVNGVGMTTLTPITKVMAHLPLATMDHKPQSAVVICFGMGTTFRALTTWGIEATAVELVPGVVQSFPYFFNDTEEVLKRPGAKVVVDDGRRFLRRADQKFDLITLDPPPPVEAAGSSLLYSEQFYDLVKSRLTDGGILQQWFPGGEERILNAVARSLSNKFPYIRAYSSIEPGGYHFLCSMKPLPDRSVPELLSRMPEAARTDLVEWETNKDPQHYLDRIVAGRTDLQQLLGRETDRILDDKPFNEYYLVRTRLAPRLQGLLGTTRASR